MRKELYGTKYASDRITTEELYERIGVRSIEYFTRARTLRSLGHVARMDKTLLPRRFLTAWVAKSRPIGGTKMTYGRSLEQWSKRANPLLNFPSGRSSPKTGRSGVPSSLRREHETPQEAQMIQRKMPCD